MPLARIVLVLFLAILGGKTCANGCPGDAYPLTTTFAYDPNHNGVTSITDPLGLVTTATYDPATGDQLTLTSDQGSGHFNAKWTFTYDAAGRVLSATGPVCVVTRVGYDGFEDLVEQVADAGAGHLEATTTYGYDSVGNLTSEIDPNDNESTLAYDADRRLTSLTAPPPFDSGPSLTQITQAYDPDGHVLTVTRADGASSVVTRWFYTPTGQVRSVVDPNGDATAFAYDADDRLASATDAVGRTTAYAYDALSRLLSVGNAAIQATPLESFTYSPDGYLASLTDANANATSFKYDGFDRLSVATYPDTSTEELAYDADSNVTSFGTRRGDTITFAYDTLNRLATKTPPSGTATVDYAYDLDSRLISASDNSAAIVPVAAPGGTTASYATTLAYDQLNRPTEVSWTPAPAQATPASSSATLGFAYDASNRRIGETSTDSSWITYPTTATSVSYSANDLNQYSGVGAYAPTYDGDGALTFDGAFTYAYDAESRLTSITEGGAVATYAYDAQGRRKLKTVGSTKTVYVTDADGREVLEYSGSTGAVERWYAYGTGPTEVLGQMNVSLSTRESLIPDIQGSIVATLDSGSGVVTKSGFWPFGENPAATTQTFGYGGERFDPETASGAAEPSGLYYDRARTYSPTLGRFFQADPVGYAAGANLYAYVDNDPLDLIDPSGLTPDNPAAAGAAASAAAVPVGLTPWLIAGSFPLTAEDVALALANARTIGAGEEAGTALSEIRFTEEGESFLRYESGNPAFSRVTPSGGLQPGTFAAPASAGVQSQSLLNELYNLPNPEIPRSTYFEINPPAGTPVIGPRPVAGGSRSEVIFPFGIGPVSVGPPIPTPP